MNINCAQCGMKLDDFSPMRVDTVPKVGDVSVCLHCSHVAVFTGNGLERRDPTAEEMAYIQRNEEVVKAVVLTMIARALTEQ